ncbi:hypothetical protein [Photobacterium damselae]|uniref:hypothetical protein n=1 Tax=Photobacterium damselae TaxID=38293 RepID=UPI002543774B
MNNNDLELVALGVNKKTILIFSNIRIVSYFVVSILFLGAAGIWLPWLDSAVSFGSFFRADNIFTFVVALLGGLLCNKVFHADRIVKDIFSELKLKLDSSDEHSSSDIYGLLIRRRELYKEQLALSAVGFLIGSIALILVIIGYSENNTLNNIYSFIGFVMSLILYLYVTAEDIDDSTKFKLLSENEKNPTPYDGDIPNPSKLFRDK